MALVTCRDCKREISEATPACPNCGRPSRAASARNAPQKGSTAGGVFGGLFLFFVVMPAVLFAGTCAVCTGAMGSFRQRVEGLEAQHAEATARKPAPAEKAAQAARRTEPAQVRRYVVVDDAAASAQVRRTPGSTSDAEVLGRVAAGTRVRVLESRKRRAGMLDVTWYGFDFEGHRGWISQYVTTGKIEEVDERTGRSSVQVYRDTVAKAKRR